MHTSTKTLILYNEEASEARPRACTEPGALPHSQPRLSDIDASVGRPASSPTNRSPKPLSSKPILSRSGSDGSTRSSSRAKTPSGSCALAHNAAGFELVATSSFGFNNLFYQLLHHIYLALCIRLQAVKALGRFRQHQLERCLQTTVCHE